MIPFYELPKHHIEPLISRQDVLTRVGEIAYEIKEQSNGLSVVLLGVLSGAGRFTCDLGESLWDQGQRDVMIDFLAVESYGLGTKSNRQPKVTKFPKLSVKDREIHVVEDIVDTGYSMVTLLAMLNSLGAKSTKVVSLLSKKSRREVHVPTDIVGFEIPDAFVVGYGIDWQEYYRAYPGIGMVVMEE